MNSKHFAQGLAAMVARLLCLIMVLVAWPAGALTVTYVHTDALGSVVAKTDENGNVVEHFDYELYGAPVGTGCQRQSGELDASRRHSRESARQHQAASGWLGSPEDTSQ